MKNVISLLRTNKLKNTAIDIVLEAWAEKKLKSIPRTLFTILTVYLKTGSLLGRGRSIHGLTIYSDMPSAKKIHRNAHTTTNPI